MSINHVQRKLAAILAADIVGFSRLTGLDEEGTAHRLRELRAGLIDPAVAAHRGRIFKTMGDGLLIEFASVVDAARCAVEVQRKMETINEGLEPERRIEFRVGIHLGDVMWQPDGDLLGDGVNIAARLEGVAQPGGVCLSSAAYDQVRDKLKERFADQGEMSLKNIARPVRVYALQSDALSGSLAAAEPERKIAKPPRLSIVVLPFANMGGDLEQDYFVDGVTESLTTDLSRMNGMTVIGRNTAFTYKGKAVDLKQIGRDLNVRYALEGSIQRGGGRMRVNAQLIDTESGSHLWADRFDKPVTDLFDMQDEIIARLAGALNAEFITVESRRAIRQVRPDALDLYFQGRACIHKGVTPKHCAEALEFAERALSLDPDNILALTLRVMINIAIGGGYQTDARAARFIAAEADLSRILALAADFAEAYLWMGILQSMTNRAENAISSLNRALSMDRNLAAAHSWIGAAKVLMGRAEEAETHVRDALRLSPRDTMVWNWYAHLGLAKLQLGAYSEAADWYRKSTEVNRNVPLYRFILAAALELSARVPEAKVELQAGLTLDPHFSVRRYLAGIYSDNPVYVTQTKLVAEGLRKAGLPEG